MNQDVRDALLEAYTNLQKIVEDLYRASDKAIENGDDDGASLLGAQAEQVFERAEAISSVISEQEDG